MVGYISRGAAYSSFSTLGVLSFISPPTTLLSISASATVITWLPYVWGALIVLSSLACLVGVVSRIWVGEFVGIGPLILCLLALGVGQLFFGSIVHTFLILGLCGILSHRWYTVNLEKRNALVRSNTQNHWKSFFSSGG